MASAAVADSFTSRDDAKRQKQLQEARAAGTAAPETDAATGKMINPHNPQFITQAPWYLNQDKPSLKHHQAWNKRAMGTKDWYRRGTKGDVKTKFVKGACQNCGATTHTKKDCVERPRQVGAQFNGKNLMPDEYIEDLQLDWDGKRDRWNGFQPEDYKEIQEEWERVEQERRNRKAAEMEERAKLKERLKTQKKALKKQRKQRRRTLRRQAEGRDTDTETDTGTDMGDSDVGDSDTDSDTDSDSDATDDEDLGEKMKDFDKTTATVPTKDDKLRTTTRNLRIREDTAKYLLNLDVNSAYYDPKSRSMRDDPFKHLKEEEKGIFRGDNFLKSAGDSKALTELMCFAWDAYKHGEKIHDVAAPTQAAKMFQVFKQRSEDLKVQQKNELFNKYGGQEHLDAPRELLYGQTDNYVEYTRDGRVNKGRERAYEKSKYEEDALIGNHSSIWGSWFDPATKQWGFACCHQTMKNAYCIPLKGRAALEAEQEEAGEESAVVAVEGEEAGEAGEASGSDSDSSSSDADGADEKTVEQKREALAEKRKARALAGLQMRAAASAGAAASSATGASSSSAGVAGAAGAADSSVSKLSAKRTSAFGHVLEDVTDLDSQAVAQAVEQAKKKRKQEKQIVGGTTLDDERNRKYNSFGGLNVDVTAEEYEAYRQTRMHADDPMAKFL